MLGSITIIISFHLLVYLLFGLPFVATPRFCQEILHPSSSSFLFLIAGKGLPDPVAAWQQRLLWF